MIQEITHYVCDTWVIACKGRKLIPCPQSEDCGHTYLNIKGDLIYMGKPIPVEKSNIKEGKQYYTCTYGCAIKVTIIKVFKDKDAVLVGLENKRPDRKPFVRSTKYLFDNIAMANSALRGWEHNERKKGGK